MNIQQIYNKLDNQLTSVKMSIESGLNLTKYNSHLTYRATQVKQGLITYDEALQAVINSPFKF